MRFVQHWASWGKRQKIEEIISGCCVGNTWSAAVLAYCSKLSKANKRQGFFNEKTARNWKYWTIKTENKYVQMFKFANLQILSDVWCKELGQPVAVVGCKWSGANGATADRHDSRMIYVCLFVCWFKMQEVFPEGGYSVPLNIIFRTYVKWSKRCNSWIDRAKLGREEQTTGQDVWFWWNRERRSKSLAQSTSV